MAVCAGLMVWCWKTSQIINMLIILKFSTLSTKMVMGLFILVENCWNCYNPSKEEENETAGIKSIGKSGAYFLCALFAGGAEFHCAVFNLDCVVRGIVGYYTRAKSTESNVFSDFGNCGTFCVDCFFQAWPTVGADCVGKITTV